MTTPEHSQRTLQSDLDDLRQSIDVWILSISADIACREKAYVALLAAAKEAVELINVWHNMSISDKEDHWRLYQSSPEMRRINAAIAAAEEAES